MLSVANHGDQLYIMPMSCPYSTSNSLRCEGVAVAGNPAQHLTKVRSQYNTINTATDRPCIQHTTVSKESTDVGKIGREAFFEGTSRGLSKGGSPFYSLQE